MAMLNITRWSEADDATLRDMAAGGHSSSHIGKILERTRNSVIGRCHRLGIKLGVGTYREGQGAASAETRKRNRWANRVTVAAVRLQQSVRVTELPRLVALPAFTAPVELREPVLVVTETPATRSSSGPVLFLDRGMFQCAWIDGDPKRQDVRSLTCCGEPVAAGHRSYCAEHVQRSKGRLATAEEREKVIHMLAAKKPSRLTLEAAE